MRPFLFLLLFLCMGSMAQSQRIAIPLAGNSFLSGRAKAGEKLDAAGWKNWGDPEARWSVYVFVHRPGTVRAYWKIELPSGQQSSIEYRIGNEKDTLHCHSGIAAYQTRDLKIKDTGYVRIDMRGIKRSGNSYGMVSSLELEGTCIDSDLSYVKDNADNYFYWGRRGPSVHINYDLSAINEDIEWFYSEITVPEGNDVIGSYFMANGFAEGYFGMQVNSNKERRMLFSVWSPFVTDDPSKIPEDKKIRLIAKGKKVHTGEFGNEGSGGQSYIVYPWKAGKSYAFLLRARPMPGEYTRYSAWFSEKGKEWQLMASFDRPATHTYLKRLHSFLENFIPETGYISRMAWYHDQWVRSSKGNWFPLNKMQFSADATARKGYRSDYKGGSGEFGFFLKNDGFFSDHTTIGSRFENKLEGKAPLIDSTRFKTAE